MFYLFIYLLTYFNPHLRLCLLILKREEGGEREQHQRESETWIFASGAHPDQGSNPQSSSVTWLGFEPSQGFVFYLLGGKPCFIWLNDFRSCRIRYMFGK